jgi:hemoglobin-like flavoprotein
MMSSSPIIPFQETIDDDEHDKEILVERRKAIIKTTWRAVRFGLDAKATEIFYTRLFDQYPGVRDLFPTNMNAQYRKLYDAVSLVVQCLDNPNDLVPVLTDLGVRHVQYGVVREYYSAVTDSFLWTLNTYIVSTMPNYNATQWLFEVAEAWDWALTFIGGVMADAADEHLARIGDNDEARMAIQDEINCVALREERQINE